MTIKNLSLTVQYGIEENLLDLVSITGIGRKRALALSRFNIKNKKDILDNKAVAMNILGKKLVASL